MTASRIEDGNTVIEEFIRHIPAELKVASGKAFRTGRRAFSGTRELYVLGLNPGGDPEDKSETVAGNAQFIQHGAPDNWAALLDQSWRGCEPGEAPLQRELRSVLGRLGLDPREVPFSDVIFARTMQGHRTQNGEKTTFCVQSIAIAGLAPRRTASSTGSGGRTG